MRSGVVWEKNTNVKFLSNLTWGFDGMACDRRGKVITVIPNPTKSIIFLSNH